MTGSADGGALADLNFRSCGEVVLINKTRKKKFDQQSHTPPPQKIAERFLLAFESVFRDGGVAPRIAPSFPLCKCNPSQTLFNPLEWANWA